MNTLLSPHLRTLPILVGLLVMAGMAASCSFDSSALDRLVCTDDAGCDAGFVCVGGLCRLEEMSDVGDGVCAGCEPNACCDAECIELASARNHCGACGVVCDAGEACVAGACTCGETAAVGVEACTAPKACCSQQCVNLDLSSANCGACGVACAPGEVCQYGACTCPAGQMPCGEGTCVDITFNDAHCGACGTVCPVGTSCTAGTCTCGGANCRAEQLCCEVAGDPTCLDVTSSTSNCNACGAACRLGELCVSGVCTCGQNTCGGEDLCCPDQTCALSCNCGDGGPCDVGLACCGASCVDTANNSAHCGQCGLACSSDRTCVEGTCKCGAGLTDCGGACVNLSDDAQNCGVCGQSCGGASCCGGACVDTSSAPLHCGRCDFSAGIAPTVCVPATPTMTAPRTTVTRGTAREMVRAHGAPPMATARRATAGGPSATGTRLAIVVTATTTATRTTASWRSVPQRRWAAPAIPTRTVTRMRAFPTLAAAVHSASAVTAMATATQGAATCTCVKAATSARGVPVGTTAIPRTALGRAVGGTLRAPLARPMKDVRAASVLTLGASPKRWARAAPSMRSARATTAWGPFANLGPTVPHAMTTTTATRIAASRMRARPHRRPPATTARPVVGSSAGAETAKMGPWAHAVMRTINARPTTASATSARAARMTPPATATTIATATCV